MEQDLFGQVLNDEDLEDELAKLDVIIAEEMIPSAGTGIVEAVQHEQVEEGVDNTEQRVAARRQPILA